jgi:uncharacterized protein (DUF305 family)
MSPVRSRSPAPFSEIAFLFHDSMHSSSELVHPMKISPLTGKGVSSGFRRERRNKPDFGIRIAAHALLAASVSSYFFLPLAYAQQNEPAKPVIVQPGAPGSPSKTLPSSTRGTLPPRSAADVAFMQGMIMHHAQAVEMTAMIPSHTQNKELHALGARISSSQSDEMKFMKRWLAARGEPVSTAMPGMADMPGMDMSHPETLDTTHQSPDETSHTTSHETMALMPGMLTPQQMEALREAKGAQFDHLFLLGMIQHHDGALTMVKDLFDTAGAGQDAEIFNFATDADNTQRAEIRIMETMLKKEKPEEKR